MLNLHKLAPKSPVYNVVDLTTVSKELVNNELSLIKAKNLSFVDSIAKLSKKNRNSSIICKALNFKGRTDEDLVSQALLYLQHASVKYFEKDRDINFSQFAITFIRKGIYDYLNQENHTNGSDLNEKIHSKIREVKKSREKVGNLTYEEVKHIAHHFNLTGNDGIRKIQEFEGIQLGTEHDWKTNIEGEEYYRFDDQRNDLGGSGYQGNAPDSVFKDVYKDQQKEFLKKQSILFLKRCNKREIVIFKGRINCQEQVALNKLSQILNVSFQMVSQIEKTIYKKFLNFCKDKLENVKNAGI